MVHIDSVLLDCYIQEEAFVRDSHVEAPPLHLADPVCLPPVVTVAGRAAGCRATQMAPLYRSLTKRCSGPRSKRYGVRMFRGETEVGCSDAVWGPGQQRSLGAASLLSSRRISELARESYLQRDWKGTAPAARHIPSDGDELLECKRGATETLNCESMSLLPCKTS
jgi:hypothetical protein